MKIEKYPESWVNINKLPRFIVLKVILWQIQSD